MQRPFLANVALAAGLLASAASAQSLVLDINTAPGTTPPSSAPRLLGETGGQVFFSASHRLMGHELWCTDGTPAGTRFVADLWRGQNGGVSSRSGAGATGNGRLYFFGNDGTGYRLWITDGTAAGTAPATPVLPVTIIDPDTLLVDGNTAWFWASDGTNGIELWKTDGTPASTTMVADINPGGDAFNGRSPMHMLAIGGTVFFRADDGVHGVELWRTDGTAAGTWMVADIGPGGDGNPVAFVELRGQLLFAAQQLGPAGPYAWWYADPTTTTATLVGGQYQAVVAQSGSYARMGDVVYFHGSDPARRGELWRTDATAAGTYLVKDIDPRANRSSAPTYLTVTGNTLYFSANDADHGRELWSSDGTTKGTGIVVDLEPGTRGSGPRNPVPYGNDVYFSAFTNEVGNELFATDGTAAGTRLVRKILPGVPGAGVRFPAMVARNGLVFAADDGMTGDEPWVTDGTQAGTIRLADINTAPATSSPNFIGTDGNLVYFAANDGVNGQEAWVTDGSAAGTRMLVDADPGSRWGGLYGFERHGGTGWISTSAGIHRTDGTPAGTTLAVPARSVRELVAFRGRLFFSGTSMGLWETDGTAGGTNLVRSFQQTVFYPVGPAQMQVIGDLLWFTASEGSFGDAGVFVSDGTAAGTTLAVRIPFSLLQRTTIVIEPFRGGALVATDDEMWFSDGTSATRLAQWPPQAPFQLTSSPDLAVVDDTGYFVARDAAFGEELWRTDGTVAGTAPLVDIRPGSASSLPHDLTAAGGVLFFAADDGTSGTELWTSDGTAAGTRMVADTVPGPAGIDPRAIVAAGSGARVVFAGVDFASGRELWVSDGTAGGTTLLSDITPGPLPSDPADFFGFGARILFTADDGQTGREPWLLPLAASNGNLVEAYGDGCPGTAGRVPRIGHRGLPTLGNAGFTVELSDALPTAPAAVLIAFDGAAFPLGGCTLLVGNPFFAVPFVTDATGAVSRPSGVPADPRLLGAELRYQWMVADPEGAFVNVLSFSDALHVMYGY